MQLSASHHRLYSWNLERKTRSWVWNHFMIENFIIDCHFSVGLSPAYLKSFVPRAILNLHNIWDIGTNGFTHVRLNIDTYFFLVVQIIGICSVPTLKLLLS